MAPPFLPYGRQLIEEDDIAAVVGVLKGDWLTTGPAVGAFEKELTRQTGAAHAIVCANGTAALHLAAIAAGMGPGDVAIVPSVTFLATANAIRFVGAEIVFADVDPDTGLMTAATLADALERATALGRPRMVLPVHLAGQCASMPAIADLARRSGLTVVEDACHALGTQAFGSATGSCATSDMTVFSFHPVKMVTMGEGGAITTNDPELALRLRRARAHGMVPVDQGCVISEQGFDPVTGLPNPWYYEMPALGYNYRASDINCALGLSQLVKLGRFVRTRQALVDCYDQALSGMPRLRPLGRQPDQQPGWHLYVAMIDFGAAGKTRGEVMRELRARGIGTQVHYLPVHRQPYYRDRYGALTLPGADSYYDRCLSLPLFASMSEDDVDRVVAALAEVLA